MSTPWEKPFVLSEVHNSAANWSLASDARLLLLMEEFSRGVFTSVQDAGSKIKTLTQNSETTQAKLANVCNNFSALSSSQFIENRVDDSTGEAKKDAVQTTAPDSKAKEETVIMERCTEALRVGLSTLDSQFQRVDITPLTSSTATSSNVAEIPKSSIFVPINPYASRRLPALIGSLPFFADDHCGLFDSTGAANPEPVSAVGTVGTVPPPPPFTPSPPPPPPPLVKPVASSDRLSEHSRSSASEEGVQPSPTQSENMPQVRPTSAILDVHSELLGKFGRTAVVEDVDEDEGDLFSSKAPTASIHPKRPVLGVTNTPAEEDFLKEDDDLAPAKPVAKPTEVKQPSKPVSSSIRAPANDLFDGNDDDDDLFSGAPKKLATKPEPKRVDNAGSSNLFFDDSNDNAVRENREDSVKPPSTIADEQISIAGDVSEVSAKPSRSESVVSQKKLPTGAVSLFGSSAKADPLAEALRRKFSTVSSGTERLVPPTSPRNVTPEPKPDSPSPPPPVVQKSPPETLEKPKSNVNSSTLAPKPSVPAVKSAASFFDEEDEEDLFNPKAAAPQQKPNVPPVSIPSNKSTASLFAADEDEDEEDLFAAPQPKPEPAVAKPSLPSSQSVAKAPPQSTSLPKVASMLFDDDDDDDLFGAVAKKEPPKPVAKVEPPKQDTPKAAAKTDTPLDANKTKSSNIFPTNGEGEQDDLFGSSAKKEPPKLTSEVEPAKQDTPEVSNKTEQPVAVNKANKNAVFPISDEDEQDDLFGAVAKVTRKDAPKPSEKVEPPKQDTSKAPSKAEPPVEKAKTGTMFLASEEDEQDDLFGKPVKTPLKVSSSAITAASSSNVASEEPPKTKSSPATTSPKIGNLKAAINPLALLPGARPPKLAKDKEVGASNADASSPVEEAAPRPASSVMRRQQKSAVGSQAGEDGSLLSFDEVPSEKQTLASGVSRVGGPARRNRPSRWTGSASQTSPSEAIAESPSPVEQQSNDLFGSPSGTEHPLASGSSAKKPQPEPVAPSVTTKEEKKSSAKSTKASALFDEDDGADLFSAKVSAPQPKVTAPPVSVPSSKPTPKPTVASSLFAQEEDEGDLFGPLKPKSQPTLAKSSVPTSQRVVPEADEVKEDPKQKPSTQPVQQAESANKKASKNKQPTLFDNEDDETVDIFGSAPQPKVITPPVSVPTSSQKPAAPVAKSPVVDEVDDIFRSSTAPKKPAAIPVPTPAPVANLAGNDEVDDIFGSATAPKKPSATPAPVPASVAPAPSATKTVPPAEPAGGDVDVDDIFA